MEKQYDILEQLLIKYFDEWLERFSENPTENEEAEKALREWFEFEERTVLDFMARGFIGGFASGMKFVETIQNEE